MNPCLKMWHGKIDGDESLVLLDDGERHVQENESAGQSKLHLTPWMAKDEASDTSGT